MHHNNVRVPNGVDIDADSHIDQALSYIQNKLRTLSKSLDDYGLPPPRVVDNRIHNAEIATELQYNLQSERDQVEVKEPLLTIEQREIYDHVLRCYENNEHSMVFIDAPGGTRKTFLTNFILSTF